MPKFLNKLYHQVKRLLGGSPTGLPAGRQGFSRGGLRTAKLLLFLALLITTPNLTLADELSSDNYIIKTGTINITGGTKSNSKVKLSDTVGQTIQGRFEDTGYRLRSGFQYGRTNESFSLTLSGQTVNFGTIKPNTLSQTSLDLTVNATGIRGYTISAIEDDELKSVTTKTAIPDTACDPRLRCTSREAAPWTSTTAYGFGYNLAGTDIDPTFVDATHFRPFANNAKNQNPAVIMTDTTAGSKATATLTFQINVSPTQPNGTYQNAVQFIALPSF